MNRRGSCYGEVRPIPLLTPCQCEDAFHFAVSVNLLLIQNNPGDREACDSKIEIILWPLTRPHGGLKLLFSSIMMPFVNLNMPTTVLYCAMPHVYFPRVLILPECTIHHIGL